MAALDHDGSNLLHRGRGGGACLLCSAEEVGGRHLDGRQGCIAGQCLRWTALAVDEI